eukprot:2562982-Pyramimonas_sp.AAC.1
MPGADSSATHADRQQLILHTDVAQSRAIFGITFSMRSNHLRLIQLQERAQIRCSVDADPRRLHTYCNSI